MNVNAWGDDVGLIGILSIGIMVVGIFCMMAWMTGGVLLKKLTGRENAITRGIAASTPLSYADPDVECPYCHWDFHPRLIDWHIREKHDEPIKKS